MTILPPRGVERNDRLPKVWLSSLLSPAVTNMDDKSIFYLNACAASSSQCSPTISHRPEIKALHVSLCIYVHLQVDAFLRACLSKRRQNASLATLRLHQVGRPMNAIHAESHLARRSRPAHADLSQRPGTAGKKNGKSGGRGEASPANQS